VLIPHRPRPTTAHKENPVMRFVFLPALSLLALLTERKPYTVDPERDA
jgi:hypothetical protein